MKTGIITLCLFSILMSCNKKEQSEAQQPPAVTKQKETVEVEKVVEPQLRLTKSQFVGAWIEPIPGNEKDYQGFVLEKDGSAFSINSATINYRSWKLVNNQLVLEVYSYGNGTQSLAKETYKVLVVDENQLVLEKGKNKISYTKNEQARYPTVNVEPYQKLVSPLLLKVNSKGVWSAIEGELGYVDLVNEEGVSLKKTTNLGILQTKEDWMTGGNVLFETVINFTAKEGTKGKLIFYNNTGEGEGDEVGTPVSFEMPVIF